MVVKVAADVVVISLMELPEINSYQFCPCHRMYPDDQTFYQDT